MRFSNPGIEELPLWRSPLLPRLPSNTNTRTIVKDLAHIFSTFEGISVRNLRRPGWTENLSGLTSSQSGSTSLTALKSIRFIQREGDEWWWSVQGKGVERVNLVADEKGTVERVRRLREAKVVSVIAELRRAAKRQKQATKNRNKELEQLEKQLQKGTTELAGMGAGRIPTGGDIGGFVRHFPLLLGLLLALVVAWPTYR